MEASVLSRSHPMSPALLRDPRASFLRLQSDERLVALTRSGNDAAFETLIERYRARLLAFCRHMVGSTEDAEDILQEVFVSAYRAMLADSRELNVRPWIYRIARNRSLNHLRRPRPTGVDSMDIFEGGAAVATADRVDDRLDLADLVQDVGRLPETQRTALMLREMGDLSYDQIAEAMDTTIPSVKSLLVRARVSLAESAESRRLSCDEVRMELGAVAEGLAKLSPPARRHVGDCTNCHAFKKELSNTNRKLTMIAPVGAFAVLKSYVGLKLFGGVGATGSAAAGGSVIIAAGTGASSTVAGTAAISAAGAGVATSGAAAAGLGAIAAKVGTGLVAAALVTGGVAQIARHDTAPIAAVTAKPVVAASASAAPKPAPPAAAIVDNAAPETVTAAVAEAVASAGPAEPAPAENPPAAAPKPVVEHDSVLVVENTQADATVPPAVTHESPGLPQEAAPVDTTPSAPQTTPSSEVAAAPQPSEVAGASVPSETTSNQ